MAKQWGEEPAILHRKVQVRILSGLAAGEDGVFELMGGVQPYDVPHHFTPDVALLEVAAAALGPACPPGSEPLEYERLTDNYLSDLLLTGRSARSTPVSRFPFGGSHLPRQRDGRAPPDHRPSPRRRTTRSLAYTDP